MEKTFKNVIIIIVIVSFLSCNKKPDLPKCISPQNGEVNVTDSVLVLSWDCVDPNGDKLVFDVYLSNDGIIESNDKIALATENNSIEVKNLEDNTVYSWQVVAVDPAGKFRLNAWQFTTGIIQK